MAQAPEYLSKLDDDFLKKMRQRWKWADESDTPQAQRERDNISFADGNMWPADLKLARQGQQPTNGLPAVPARPTLVIDKVKEPIQQILNQERQSDIGVTLEPADDFGDLGVTPDDTEVTLREGMIRRIQRDSEAADARTWAFKRAVTAGRGYYQVMTRFLPGRTFDQEVYVRRIYNQSAVLLDPSHEQPDGSDADFEFVGTWVPFDRYKAMYPTLADEKPNPLKDAGESEFMAAAEAYPDWYRAEDGEDGERAVRVVDYWYTEHVTRKVALTADGKAYWDEEPPEDDQSGEYLPAGAEVISRRMESVREIHFCKVGGGVQILEETVWPCEFMPIIKVVGDEVLPYDEQRRFNGIVTDSVKDSNRGLNYMASKITEQIGLTPIPPVILDPESIEGYEEMWKMAATRTLPALYQRTWDDQGREYRPAHRPALDPNLQPMAFAFQMYSDAIKSTTSVPDSTLGNVDPSLKSGRAIREVVANAAMSTSHFIDNLTRSIRYEGRVENALLYPIYGTRPGRMVRLMTGEGESESMRIVDEESYRQLQQDKAQAAKVGRLTKDAKFNIVVKVSKTFDSRRQELATKLGEVIAIDPAQMGIMGDILYKHMDIPEAKQLAERMKVMLAPPVQALLASKEQGREVDPQAQAQIAQLTAQIEQMGAQMQQLAAAADGKQAELAMKLQIAQVEAQRDEALERLKLQVELEKARMDNDTKLAVAQMGTEAKNAKTIADATIARAELDHDAEQAELGRQAAAETAAMSQQMGAETV